jgi:hypothetical protein
MSAARVAFDLDGTALAFPELLGPIAKGLRKAGFQVGILSERDESKEQASLEEWDTAGYHKPDFAFFRAKGAPHQDPKEWKPEQMKLHGIAALLDDFDGEYDGQILLLIPAKEDVKP